MGGWYDTEDPQGLLRQHDSYAVCDEVYEHLVFDGRRHIPLMTLPGMRERCLRIGSAGKTFSLTGWKIGYITACPALATVAEAGPEDAAEAVIQAGKPETAQGQEGAVWTLAIKVTPEAGACNVVGETE